MKKIALLTFVLCIIPVLTSAHERQTFEINGINYQFVVGSVGEPVYVDDKSGVEVRVERVSVLPGHEEHHSDVGPGAVIGLEKTMQVDLVSGDRRKTLELSPGYNEPGLYRAVFFPTASTQIGYRFYGTLEDIPVDITFTCSPAGHVMEAPSINSDRVTLSPGVVRTSQTGSFGCPREKAEIGFPYEATELATLQSDSTRMIAWGAAALSLLAVGLVLSRRR